MSKKRAAILRAFLAAPSYGHALRATLGRRDVYPALRAMEREGLLRSWFDERGEHSWRRRRYYGLTEAGRKRAEYPWWPVAK